MARLLVFLHDNQRPNHPCPHMAARPFDIVKVLPDGTPVGRKVTLPKWAVVDLPGVPVDKLLPLVVVQAASSDPDAEVTLFRARRLGRNRLPVPLLNAIEKDGYLEVSVAKSEFILDYVENKATGETAREEGLTL